jgi:hypothetical protein
MIINQANTHRVDCVILLLCVAVLNRHQIHIAQITGFTLSFRLGFMLPFLIFNVQDLWVVFVHVFFPFTIVLSFGIDLCLVITSCFILNSLTPINTWIWKKFMNSGPHQRQKTATWTPTENLEWNLLFEQYVFGVYLRQRHTVVVWHNLHSGTLSCIVHPYAHILMNSGPHQRHLTFFMKRSSFRYYQDTKHYNAMYVNFIICLNRLSVLVILINNE